MTKKIYQEELNDFFQRIDEKRLNECVDSILERNVIYTCGIGKSSFPAMKLAASLRSMGMKAFFIHPSEASHGDVGCIDENDAVVFVSKSGESKELWNILEYSRINGAETVSVVSVDAVNSTLSRNTKWCFPVLGRKEIVLDRTFPTISVTECFIFFDIMCSMIARKISFSEEDFRKYHAGGKLSLKLKKVKDIMLEPPVVHKDTNILDALLVMEKYGYGTLFVVDKDMKMKGIVTDYDIRKKLIETSGRLEVENISELCHYPKLFFDPEEKCDRAYDLMRENMTNIAPVLEEGVVKGIIHIRYMNF